MTGQAVTVLVVDDDEANRYFKAHTLTRNGYRVIEAERGDEALRLVEAEEPALVLLDVRLPDMSGIDVCRRIKTRNSGTLVLQTSAAFTSGQDKVAGLEGGADSYLVEPIEPDELPAIVKSLLRLHRAEQDLRSLNENLELRVTQRTAELAEANRQLVTESRQRAEAEEALRHALKLDALGQLTGGVAHDFNNLLTVVLGNLDLIEQGMGRNPPMAAAQVSRLVAGARRAGEDCARLTRQLLAFARRDPLRLEVCDINSIVARFDHLLKRAVGERITVNLELAPESWRCAIDVSQFEAAILNLAINARDAMEEGGRLDLVVRNISIRDRAQAKSIRNFVLGDVNPGDYVCVEVKDTGCGIEDEVLAHAFDPFFTTKDIGQGSGLGLSQVYGFVRQCGGYLTVETKMGLGTTIKLHLPRSGDAQTLTHPEEHKWVERERNGRTILVVEDNEGVLNLTVEVVKDLGYQTLIATDAIQALDILRGDALIDLLFTDVVMPHRMNGIDLARKAKLLRPGLKVLLTSGYAAHRREATTSDVEFPMITKPYRRAALAQAIKELLEHETGKV